MLRRHLYRLACAAVASLVCVPAQALEFRSVAEPALLYDAPSAKAEPKFIIARGTPVEVVVTLDKWLKVRDSGGELLWIERAKLAEAPRTVIVTAARAEIRKSPEDTAAMVFEATKDVVLELLEAAPAGWARVRHADGLVGYVRVTKIWGV